jgi:Uma2 family endonuclease
VPTLVSISDKIDKELWSAEEFLEWLKPGIHADLIAGEKLMHSPVNLRHADLLNFADHLLRSFIEANRLGRLYREVVAVRLSGRDVFLPDLAYFTNEQAKKLGATHISMAPTLVVEALSPWSADRDTGPKLAAYEVHGVREYWVLDPDHLMHRFYRLEGEIFIEFGSGEEIVRAQTVPGFSLKRSWLNPVALPPVAGCLREIGIVP